jgi:hypothetical protein
MGMRRIFLVVVLALASQSLFCKEILVGVELVPIRKMAVIFTPIVLPDLISAKFAFEYRLHRQFNLIIPIEAKWMDYHRAIKLGARIFGGDSTLPETLYDKNRQFRIGWNIDFSQLKISAGVGAKWFPFSESMTDAFFVKTLMMVGYERFFAYSAEGRKDAAVFTHVATIGYNWVKGNRFTFGFEAGEEYTWHVNAIKKLPMLIGGLMPILQFSLGFTI